MDRGGAIFALFIVLLSCLSNGFFRGARFNDNGRGWVQCMYELRENVEVRECGKMTLISTTSNDIDGVTKGDFFQMLYNPPWIPPSLLRNEIAIEVD